MIHTDENDFRYFNNLDEAKEEGYVPVKCYSVLAFYTLKGRVTKLLKENLEPIRFLYYALYDPNVNRYYLRFAHPHSVDCLYFFRKDNTFKVEDDISVDNLRNWVLDGNITLLYTKPQVQDVSTLLERLWKAQFKTEGKVDYRLYLELLKLSLDYEDYINVGKGLTGYKSVCHEYEVRIDDVWKRIKEKSLKL